MSDKAVIRGTSAGMAHVSVDRELDLRISKHRSLFTASGEPKLMEMARAGVLYGGNNGSAVGLANVAAIPTTTASYALYNNSATKSAVVLKIAMIATTVAPPKDFAIIAGLPATAQGSAETKYANSLALPINVGQEDAESYITDAVTLAATPLWQVIAHANGNGILLGASAIAWVNGMYIVPPKFALGVDIVGSAGTTPLFDIDVLWAELDLTD